MAEDQDKKGEEKFEFTAEGEALGYISSDQAQVLAMRTARETPGAYGSTYVDVPMAFDVLESDDTEDHYRITLSIRPQGEFRGRPGQEQFFIEKEGTVAHRQVLSLPMPTRERRFPVVPVAIGLVLAGAVVVAGIVFAGVGPGRGGNDKNLVAAVTPTNTPVPTAATSSSRLPAAPTRVAPTPTTAPASTQAPAARVISATALAPTPTSAFVVGATPMPTVTPAASPTPLPPPTPTPVTRRFVVPAGPVPTPFKLPAATPTLLPTATSVPLPTPTRPPTPTRRPPPTATPIPGFAAGKVVTVGYNSALYLSDRRAIKNLWEPGETDYALRWEASPQPAMLTATLDTPLDARRGGEPLPYSFTRESDKYVYQWRPAGNFWNNVTLFLIRDVSTDAGLRITRSVTPEVLPPGLSDVLVEATLEILRPPTVRGVPVKPVGGSISIRGKTGALTAGSESNPPKGLRPLRIISAAGVANRNLGPFFDVGQTYSVRLQAVIENPNPFPVTYLPYTITTLDFDAESITAPFRVSMPQPLEPSAKSVTVQATGIDGETVKFTFTNPSEEKVFWIFREPYFRGIWHTWQEGLVATP